MKAFLPIVFTVLLVTAVLAMVVYAEPASKPEWTGMQCDNLNCVRDTLNNMYPDRAVDAKIVPVPSCGDGNCVRFWIFYRK